nr:hypothetical protein [Tanacetum cinerariifolium]
MSRSPERTSIFSRIRHDRTEPPKHRPVGKGRRDDRVSNRLGAKKRVCPHTQKSATRVLAQEERNPSPKNVTMKKRVHEGHRCFPKPKAAKKRETSGKDKPLEILMVQPWQRVSRQRITQSFSPSPEIWFPPSGDEDETKGPMIIDVEIGEYMEQTIAVGFTLTKEGRKALCELLRRNLNLEVYVDDLVIKSRMEQEIIRDIKETFRTLREIYMKMNPKKCTFGVEEGMLLGYNVNTKGINTNRFLSKSAEKSLLFFKALKKCIKKSDFQWTAKAKASFKQMKKLMAELPTLTAPMEKEKLIVYLATAREAKLSVKLGKYDIHYRPRKSLKGQILAYFITKCLRDDSLVTTTEGEEEVPDPWTLFTNGSSCIDGFGVGLILTNPEGIEFTYALRFRFDATNNEAKYEASIAILE